MILTALSTYCGNVFRFSSSISAYKGDAEKVQKTYFSANNLIYFSRTAN